MPAALLLLAVALGIIGYGIGTGGGLSARVARLIRSTSRRRAVLAWAAGTAVTYGLSSVIALALLGRIGAIAAIPAELRDVAWRFGLPAYADPAVLETLAFSLATGVTFGIGILAVRRGRGKPLLGLRYRSPAAARDPGDWPAALVLAVSAGVSEELFFRLLVPLLIAIVTGSGVAGIGVATIAFAVLHRHQGWAGVAATGLTGAALFYLYLLTGQLWVPVLLHVLIDVSALILRPWLTRPLSSSAASPS